MKRRTFPSRAQTEEEQSARRLRRSTDDAFVSDDDEGVAASVAITVCAFIVKLGFPALRPGAGAEGRPARRTS